MKIKISELENHVANTNFRNRIFEVEEIMALNFVKTKCGHYFCEGEYEILECKKNDSNG